MKRLLTTIAAAIMAASGIHAADSATIKTGNGLYVNVEACSDKIFHIRISGDKDFEESLMERYGIVRSDWDAVKLSRQDKAGTVSFRTEGGILKVRKSDGSITLERNGKTLVSGIRMLTPTDPLCTRLAGVINDKFSQMHVASNGGIIGDDNGKFSQKDMQESGDVDKSSVITIPLKADERFYGGGSTSRDHIQHRGELLRMWTTYQHTEIPVPFMLSSAGWGIFNNTTRKNFFDVGSLDTNRFNIYNTFRQSDFYLIAADSMPDAIDSYTQITGRTYVLPKWAYGLGFGPNMKEEQFDILNDAVHFRQYDVPCDFFWLEPQWMTKRYDFSTAKAFNADRFSVEPYWKQKDFPKQEWPRLFIGKLHSMGFKLGLWLCEEYDLSITEEDAIAARSGKPQSGQEHWMDHLSTFLDLGVDGFKLDPARTIDEHTFWEYYNGCTDKEMHNINQVLLPKQLVQMVKGHTGKRTWHHYCGGWAGIQHWSAATSGDNGGGKTALFDQLNLGMSGYMNTSCDVMSVEKELEMQSLHFGMFLPWTQINSWFSMMHPFYYSPEEQVIYRNCIKLRYSLLPYIYSMALEGSINGMPMVRSMPLQFPDDRNCDDMCYQYMFGDSFLVGIFTDEVYLPAGNWYDYWTGERISSKGQTLTLPYPSDRAGLLLVRDGAIVPTIKDVQFVGSKPFDDVIFKIYPHGSSCYVWYDDDGQSFGYENGAIASRTVRCDDSANVTGISVSAVSGSFEGMPQSVNIAFEVRSETSPSSVCVGSNSLEWTYADNTLKFEIKDISPETSLQITISK